MSTDFLHAEYLVSTLWLAQHLSDSDIVILDGTTHLLPRSDKPYDVVSGSADFAKGHIPGAQFVDIDNTLSDPNQDPALHFMLPSAALFAQRMAELGIGNDTHVICYATANHWWATRLWWMLRVFGHTKASVLDGGFQKWAREGRAIETGAAKPRPRAVFVARFNPDMVATKEDVLNAIGDASVCTVNALRPEQHRGEPGGSNYGRPGHITGSINVAAVNVVDENNVFKPAAELRAMFKAPLASKRVITYCGGGIAASSDALILTMFGHNNVKLYDASLSEWARDPSLPMQTGT